MDAIRVQIDELDAIEIGHLDAVVRNDQGLSRHIERIVSLVLTALALLLAIVAGVVARSIRQRSEALARVRLLSERQAAMFDGGVDGMMLLDARGYILRLNPSVIRMFGYSSEELIGQHNTELMDVPFDLETSQAWLDQVGKAGLDGAGRRHEFIGRRKDGTTFATEVAVSRVSEGEDRRYVAAIRDISAFKRAEQMKNEFVSTVSHELRTPLTSIAGSLGLLSAGAVGQLNEKAARLVGIAHSNCERLIRLINDILDIEKIESGKMHFAEEEVDIGALIEWTIAANRSLADSKEVELVAETPAERVLVRGDTDRLEQLLTNLVSNAIKHSPTGGTVDVAATTGSTRIAIDVMDRGAGIPEEFRSRIFGKFAMADTSDTRAKGGSGLGLSIAREIAHHHGGTILFQDRPGGGTIFRAELPVLTQIEQTRKSSRKLPVLLHVDDDRDCLSVVASAFEDRAEVLTVGTIEEARRAIARHRIDGAILDIGLRDGNGGSLIPLLRRRDPVMPVVVFSAIDEPHNQFAADAVVIKSRASLDDLVSTTMALLGDRGRVAA
jgi:PAS domain S-box-containing protein